MTRIRNSGFRLTGNSAIKIIFLGILVGAFGMAVVSSLFIEGQNLQFWIYVVIAFGAYVSGKPQEAISSLMQRTKS